MKLVYCVPALYNPGGMERVLTEKVNYLVGTGKYDITIVTTDQNGRPAYFPLDDRIKLVDFGLNFEAHFACGLLKKTWLHYKKQSMYKRKLQDYLMECKADICISLCGKEIDFLTSLKDGSRKMAEIHFSKSFRLQFFESHKRGLLWKWIGQLRTGQLEKATKKLDTLVVLTQQDLKDWLQTNKNAICIPNPSPLQVVEHADWDSKRVIAVGRLDAQKGYDYLIKIWRVVAERFPDWRLDIYGRGELESDLRKQIYDAGLADCVSLKGVTQNVVKEYLSSSIFVMSSRYEGLPMVLIEAMACGLPLVSFDCECGPRDVIQDGVNGFLIPTFDVEGFADKLMCLMGDRQLRELMGVKGKEMSGRYAIDAIMQQWINLFDAK